MYKRKIKTYPFKDFYNYMAMTVIVHESITLNAN